MILDVRTPGEFRLESIKDAININDLNLRDKLNKIPKDKEIFVYCEMGFRGYLATRLLLQKGYKARNLTGGFKLYKTALATIEEIAAACGPPKEVANEIMKEKTKETNDFTIVDACGLTCPGPLNALIQGLEKIPQGKKLKVYATDPGFKSSVEAYAKLNEGIKLIYLGKEEGKIVAELQKGEVSIEDIETPIKQKKVTRKELRALGAPPISEINAQELYGRMASEGAPAILIDVRTPQEYNGPMGHIKGAKLIPLGDLMNNIEQLANYRNEEIIAICHSGSRSTMAAQLLAKAGFKVIRNLTGGMMTWHKKGLPIVKEGN